MTTELQMLIWATVLGLVQLAAAASFNTAQRGLAWGAGPRDETPAPVSPVAARIDRAFRNFLETYAFFAVAVLLLQLTGRNTAQTALGAQVYFWARVLYVPAYAIGAPYLRTLVWAAALVGIVLVLRPLLQL
ncbi:MAG: MAPEG family protein [Arenimonas sp.]